MHLAPHAALLIDFDNVTLGIRSDLTKELRTLLNSDIIKGKVAVQRAYADWRRYPQYIVPLSESSIDLIFAPAFGTNKKNATDIRLAVDAIELVFTRQEIGTFILLSGDSDFSSLVIKLKEYGKYVIGVGIRESASDLLIQNCDEYYSYSDLAGLTKEADTPSLQRDPWELVVESVEKMARDSDVMRSDRLKQVMQQVDPNFDEKNAGFNRFSKFVTEAGNRGLIRVTKLDNGQFEVAPVAAAAAALPAPAPRREAPTAPESEENGRRGRRGRGRGRGRDRSERSEPRPETPALAARADGPLTLAESFDLMQRALGELRAPVDHDRLRARMVALLGREDELLEPSRFARLLRQANDAEVADVRRAGVDGYEVSPHRLQRMAQAAVAAAANPPARRERTEPPAGAEATAETPIAVAEHPPAESPAADPARRPPTLRFRRGSRGPVRSVDVPLVGVVKFEPEIPVEKPKARKPRSETAPPRARKPRGDRAASPKAESSAVSGAVAPAAKPAGRPRRRSRAKAKEPKPE
ncbi:MAG TPA: NYN domain-containing protein [Gemmatimonadales bacterium]